ncbi:bifunctional metallophosphatase/5'-nucleotidase [Acidobacteriota bacterium]
MKLYSKNSTILLIGVLFLLCGSTYSVSEEVTLTIVHTNDMHSHLLGYGPNIEYTPNKLGDEKTLGGWARIAAVISKIRAEKPNPVLVCDAGDFLMGSLFHLMSREKAFELELMSAMGYDAITLGNHEFDLTPNGLARILEFAAGSGHIPPVLLSNMIFNPESKEDDTLEALYNQNVIKPYRIFEKEGLKIGVFGLMGINAAEVAPFASPISFGDPIEEAKKMVSVLRDKEGADIIISLSHSGLNTKPKKSEDEILAKKVSGIDIILSGHTHTLLEVPVVVNNTLIVQAGENGKNVGILDVIIKDGQVVLDQYESIEINDSIMGDESITNIIQSYEAEIDSEILSNYDMNFREIIAHTDFDLTIREDESPLGNLVADSIRWALNEVDSDPLDLSSKVTVSVMSNGLIRDSVLSGRTGDLAVCDVFRAVPLGIGRDDSMGYPLISVYLYASEIKKALEVLTSISPLKGPDFFLQISGVKFAYNPLRMIFDRVTRIQIENKNGQYEILDYSLSNKTLYRVGADYYNASFLKFVGDFTMKILKIDPKDRNGQSIEDLENALVDADKKTPGVQELKEWNAVMDYIRSFPDTDGDGLPEIPEKYREKEGRIIIEKSWNPFKLLRRGTYVTWIPVLLFLLILTGIVFLVRFVLRKIN